MTAHPLPVFSSVTQSCLTLCDPINCSTPGFPVHHQLLEPTQTHVHRVGDAIQPSHPLSSPSPPMYNLSQGLFQWVGSLHQVAKVHFTMSGLHMDLPGGSDNKVSACNVRDLGLIPGSGISSGELATHSSILP